ncbi:DNA polymerase-3 subunit beta [Seinonella peptonophila]|uniref:Beta sliding clamp n=1 Tax=Seinonella peptonophila TaxID=112248 RepID=A0A1M4WZA4_9BACL|nr:DNA polymerase III subunit beta [Seinonella peptonophila]SHE86586.1 DNA polymerase-3 subunit beta [Seinonella peptonophila]
MKFQVSKSALVEAVSQVSKAVSSKTTIPILTGIQVIAHDQGLCFTGSNSDLTIQVNVPNQKEEQQQVTVEEMGNIVLPGRILGDIVRKLPGDQVTWETTEKFQTVIQSEQARFELIGLDPDEYPRLPHLTNRSSFTLHTDTLRTIIRQTQFAVSHDEAKMILTGVLWQLKQGKLTSIGTDGHRLARKQVDIEGSEDLFFEHVIIPGKSMAELAKTFNDSDGYVDIVVADNQLLVQNEHLEFYTRLIEGKYPNTDDFIPEDGQIEVICSTRDLLQSVDRASLISRGGRDHVIKWTIKDGIVEISSISQEIGKVTEQVKAQVSGEELSISFNPRYMMEALRSLDCEEVRLLFKGTMAPFTLRPKEYQDTLHLILPIRTH